MGSVRRMGMKAARPCMARVARSHRRQAAARRCICGCVIDSNTGRCWVCGRSFGGARDRMKT